MPENLRFAWDATTAARFAEYHAANPQVYLALRRFALEARRAGRDRMGMKALFERVRWFTEVETTGDSFKVNNSYTAHYARLLMACEPELIGFFETRKAKADAA
jgi:hypothetical protein